MVASKSRSWNSACMWASNVAASSLIGAALLSGVSILDPPIPPRDGRSSLRAKAEAGELLELAPVGALERYRLPAAPTGQTCLPLLACEQLDCVAPERFGEALRRVTGQVRRIAHVGGAGQELRLL